MGRRTIDWMPIEVEVRLGKMTRAAIAEKFQVSYSRLRKKCEEEGWEADLTPVVQAATRAELTRQARQRVEGDVANQVDAITSGIDAAVAENVKIINRHRAMSGALLDLVDGLGTEIKALTASADTDVKKALSIGDRVDAVRKLSQTVATVVQVERQAYSLDEKTNNSDAGQVMDWFKSLNGATVPVVQDDPEQGR